MTLIVSIVVMVNMQDGSSLCQQQLLDTVINPNPKDVGGDLDLAISAVQEHMPQVMERTTERLRDFKASMGNVDPPTEDEGER